MEVCNDRSQWDHNTVTHHTHILIHGEFPLPPSELADGDDGGEGNARDQHHVETCEYIVLVIISIESTLICLLVLFLLYCETFQCLFNYETIDLPALPRTSGRCCRRPPPAMRSEDCNDDIAQFDSFHSSMILRGCFAVNSYFESNGKLYCASHPQSISIQKHGPDDRFNYSWNEFSLKIRNLNETCFSPPCRSLRPSVPPTTSSWAWPQLPSLSSGSRPGIWRLCTVSLKIYFDSENISLFTNISSAYALGYQDISIV